MACSRLSLLRLPVARLHLRSLSLASARLAEQPTHTGQQWEEHDLRQVRFAVTGTEKQVNTQWAVDLIAAVPPKKVHARVVGCDGGGGALGHPKIFINLDTGKPESCNYCGLRFEMEPHH